MSNKKKKPIEKHPEKEVHVEQPVQESTGDGVASFIHSLTHVFDNTEKEDINLYPTFKAINTKPSRAFVFIYVVIILMIFTFFIWAAFFEVDAYVNARGEVETFSKTSSLTAPTAKVISEIHVKEGQKVSKGDLLITFDKVVEEANKESIEKQYYSNMANIARLEAQLKNTDLKIPKEVQDYSKQIAEDARQRFKNETHTLQNGINLSEQKVIQKNTQVEKIKDQIKVYSEKVKLVTEQVQLLKNLEKQKLVTKLRLIESQKELVDDQLALDAYESDLPRIESELEELQIQKSQLLNDYKTQVSDQLNEARTLSAQLEAGMTGTSQELQRSTIISPIDGTVFRIPNTTLSSSVQAGQEIISLIPFEDSLIVEANVRPEDIGLLKVGQPANVKVTAYDYAIYGLLKGEVLSISPETYEDPTSGKPYFKVKVKTDRNYLLRQEQKFYISPGMIAMVDVIIDKRTVLQYITNPFIKTVRESLGEK